MLGVAVSATFDPPRPSRRGRDVWRGAVGLVAALLAASCVFELGDVVSDGAGGGGAGGGGGSATGPSRQVTIQLQPLGIQGTLDNFPVMVRLDSTRIDYGLTQDGGQDLRFWALDGTTPLAHEIERWDETGESIVWVTLPQLDASTSGFLMRFGDPEAADGQDPASVWTAYEAVYHLADDLTAGNGVHDSAGPHDALATNVTATPGRAGQGFAFDGSTSRVDLSSVAAFDAEPGQGRSVSLLFRRNTTAIQGMTVLRTRTDCCNGWALQILGDQYANVRFDIRLDAAGCCNGSVHDFGAVGLPDGSDDVAWHHLLVTMDRASGTTAMYRDGMEIASGTVPTDGAMLGGVFAMGVDEVDSGFLLGDLDEVRIGSVAVSAEWATLAYRSLDDSLLSYGPVVAVGP
jgi:hypothetical protein